VTNFGQRDFDAYGSAQQKGLVTPLAQGDMLRLLPDTEPHVGSDASPSRPQRPARTLRHQRQAVHHQRQKNGDVAIVIAVTDKGAGKRHERVHRAHQPGYSADRLEDKLGQHSSDTAQVTFD
jgi:alkylation response protein AidB-like acyl-CoA dehydrogenase